ncbi:IS30 family transposase [Mycoplasmopsis mustelae]|uniref:IS30 family transposase n=1 Tax=Mycoplasmopsis mustelae TaxID=171289 RepID=UPI001F3C02A7|nr:IS30 family transposase [Mycoplasmopsis mustelae]
MEFSEIFKKKFNKRNFGVDVTYQFIKNTKKIKRPSLRSVFNWINSGIWIINRNDCLRKKYKKRNKEDYQSASDKLVGKRLVRPIWSRPKIVMERKEFGHWEIDLIIGKNRAKSSHLITFTKRLSRYGIIILLKEKNPWLIIRLLWDTIKKYKLNIKSITQDNGWEFNKLFYLAYRLGIYIYKTEAYASQQKASIENFNSIVRRYFPKGTSFNNFTEEEILKVQNKINNMPRKLHNYQSADEIFFDYNYYKDKWKEIPENEPLYVYSHLKRKSNTSKNTFFKKYK